MGAISMTQCKTAVTPLLNHRSYYSLALNHRFSFSLNLFPTSCVPLCLPYSKQLCCICHSTVDIYIWLDGLGWQIHSTTHGTPNTAVTGILHFKLQHQHAITDGMLVLNLEMYHQTSNISHTNSPNLNLSHLVLQLSLPNPGVKSRMKM